MCIRYALTLSRDELVTEFGVKELPEEFPTGYNLSPFHYLPVIRRERDGKPVLRLKWWGLIPAWSGADHKVMHVNARAETLAKKPSFHDAYRKRRCIIPASGFFEWARDGLLHQPNYIQPVAGTAFGLAGLWDRWLDADGGSMETFTVLTIEANERVLPISQRMPVILEKDSYRAWLDPETPIRTVHDLAHACAPERLLAYPVSPAVNSPENDSPDVIRPLKTAVV